MTEKKSTAEKAAAPKPDPIAFIKLRRKHVEADTYFSGYRQVHVKMDDWEWQGNVSYVPSYCGAKFWWDFQTNYTMNVDLREYMKKAAGNELSPAEEERMQRITPQVEQMYRAIMYAMMVEHIDSIVGIRGSRESHHPKDWGWDRDSIKAKMGMDFTLWEIEHRPMYAFALYHGLDMLPPRNNPNSGNTASFFAGPPTFDFYMELYLEFKDTVRVEWVDNMYDEIDDIGDDYPFDDEPYEEEW